MLKLREAGVTNEAIVAFIRQNVRVPDATMGDIWGQIAAGLRRRRFDGVGR